MLIARRSSYWTGVRRSACLFSRRTYRAAAVNTFPLPPRLAQRGHQLLQLRASYSNGKPFNRDEWTTADSIKAELERQNYDTFGYMIYRTTYTPESDVLWPRFQQILWERARHEIGQSKYPELINKLVYTYVEDARLEGATAATLRTVFDAWRRSPEAQAEQPRAQHSVCHEYGSTGVRYNYCIRASDEAIRSVVLEAPQPPEWDMYMEGFVDFIDVNWKPNEYDDDTPEENKDDYEPIEGCVDQDVGWMRIGQEMLPLTAPEWFSDGSMNDAWFWFYQRPPDVSFRL